MKSYSQEELANLMYEGELVMREHDDIEYIKKIMGDMTSEEQINYAQKVLLQAHRSRRPKCVDYMLSLWQPNPPHNIISSQILDMIDKGNMEFPQEIKMLKIIIKHFSDEEIHNTIEKTIKDKGIFNKSVREKEQELKLKFLTMILEDKLSINTTPVSKPKL